MHDKKKDSAKDSKNAKVDKPNKLHDAAAALGKAGGEKGGPARDKALSSAQKSKIAKLGAEARWKNKKHIKPQERRKGD